MKISIFSIGTRGDVQPFLALAVGLQQAGHQVTLVAPRAYTDWIKSYSVTIHPVQFDVREIMQQPEMLAALQSGNLLRQFQQARAAMRTGMRAALADFEQASQVTDFLIQTIGGHGAVEIADQRRLPMAFAYLQPFARTRAFPSFFLNPVRVSLGSGYNFATHILADYALWLAYGQPTNEWRATRWGLSPWRSFGNMHCATRQWGTPSLFAYSPNFLPKPTDWDTQQSVTGYWFLDAPPDWQPEAALAQFLAAGPPPVYVGFGSLSLENAERLTRVVEQALRMTGQRGLLATGWGGLKLAESQSDMFYLEHAPHDWLFPRVVAVVHHGGAGTTGAALRAGTPQIITPLVLDQYAWANQVAQAGIGPRASQMKNLTAKKLAGAINVAVNDAGMRARAAALGEKIRAENGVARAVEIIERHAAEFKQRSGRQM